MTTVEALSPHRPRTPRSRRRVLRGLLWREWVLYYPALSWLLTIWLIAGWVLVLLNFRPEFVVLFVGSAFALRCASTMGGGDVADGSEEFAFAMPISRSAYYLVRMAFGLAALLGFCISTHLIAAWNLPQKAWGLIVTTGFTAPSLRTPREYHFLVWLSVLLPLAYFGLTYSNAAVSRTARSVHGTDSTSLFIITTLAGLALFAETYFWPQPTGYFTNPLLAVIFIVPLVLGYLGFIRKEVVDPRR